jgi:predicted acylesterase/phospholipase RssA
VQGVVKALFEHTMLPRVVAGSSVGSIVAGMIATRTDDELRETFRKLDNIELSFFNNSRATELVHSFLQKGALHDMSYLQVRCCRLHVAARCLVLRCASGVSLGHLIWNACIACCWCHAACSLPAQNIQTG